MDKKKLTEIIEIFKESGLGKMEISETSADKTFSLKLEKNADMVAALPVPAAMPAPVPASAKDGAVAEPSPTASRTITSTATSVRRWSAFFTPRPRPTPNLS